MVHAGSDNDVYSETVKFCHAFIVQAEIGKSILINHYPSAIIRPIITIPHGSYIGIYQDSITKSEARKQLKIKDKNLAFI